MKEKQIAKTEKSKIIKLRDKLLMSIIELEDEEDISLIALRDLLIRDVIQLSERYEIENPFVSNEMPTGGWLLAHIKPCDSFDLTKESEQKLCFHYSNIAPVWAKDIKTKCGGARAVTKLDSSCPN